MAEPYRFERRSRRRGALLIVVAIWAAIGAALALLDLSPIIAGLAALLTLPALFDYAADRRAGLILDGNGIRWFSGTHQGKVALARIAKARLDTRLDLSVRLSLVLTSGRRIRLPAESTPPAAEVEERLRRHGVRTERHHFSLV